MKPATLRHHLRRLAASLLALLPALSLVAVKDLYISLYFRLHNLRPAKLAISPTTTLHLWLPRRRRPRKPALLLVHGFGGNAKWQFCNQVGPLSNAFDVYVPDLVFFGGSFSAGGGRSVAFQARCVAAAMRRLRVRRYSVAGVSYGGFVAYRMAAEVEEVERLVVMTAGVGAAAEEMREMADGEGRDVSEMLLPETAEDLMSLMRRSMYRSPEWVPEFLLKDFIQVGGFYCCFVNYKKKKKA